MQKTKPGIIHKIIIVALTAAALFTSTAWLANFKFPLAVLQTVGLVNKGRVEGVDWQWDLIIRDDTQRKTWVSLYVTMQVLSLAKRSWYLASQVPETPRNFHFGPFVYSTQVYKRTPSHRVIDRLQNGTKAQRLSVRYIEAGIALWLLWPLFAAYPLWSLVRGPLTLRYRRKHGLCLNCGYSLKQLAEPRCPECGCEIESTASA